MVTGTYVQRITRRWPRRSVGSLARTLRRRTAGSGSRPSTPRNGRFHNDPRPSSGATSRPSSGPNTTGSTTRCTSSSNRVLTTSSTRCSPLRTGSRHWSSSSTTCRALKNGAKTPTTGSPSVGQAVRVHELRRRSPRSRRTPCQERCSSEHLPSIASSATPTVPRAGHRSEFPQEGQSWE